MRIGIFGGTFDPPHRAHTMAIVWALQTGEVDRVLVIPAARHAFGKEPGASFAHRVAMCRIAIEPLADGLATVDPLEGEREGKSFMVDTIRILRDRHPDDSCRLLVGTDIIDDLPKWREGEAVVELAPPLEIPRIVTDSGDPARGLRPGALPMVSSTEVRERLAAGREDAAELIAAPVLDYIRIHKLYGGASG
ncbi:nicotinate-nicotinamide nucleotide adenylyltransferase [bacterium]|nr:nicotinate-nicotinamide nucleotide adenylyltransferase [bacterium]